MIAVIGLVLPAVSLGQSACPDFRGDIARCYSSNGCDDAGRLAFVRALRAHDEQLISLLPALTDDERNRYGEQQRTATTGQALADAFRSEIGSRIAVQSSISQRMQWQMTLIGVLSRGVSADETGIADPLVEDLRDDLSTMWVQLAKVYAESSWVLAWDRVRSARLGPRDADAEPSLESDLANCGIAVNAMLQIVVDDLDAG